MNCELTNMEELVMKCIWELREEPRIVVSILQERLNENYDRNWKIQTVSTYVAHLVRKGYLSMFRDGKVYFYEPLVWQREYLSEKIKAQEDFWGREYFRSCMEP